jgi:hypothetical protein
MTLLNAIESEKMTMRINENLTNIAGLKLSPDTRRVEQLKSYQDILLARSEPAQEISGK